MKKILISMMMAAASLGMMAQADAASGYVAVEKAAKDKGVDMVINARDVIYGGIDLTDAVKANMK